MRPFAPATVAILLCAAATCSAAGIAAHWVSNDQLPATSCPEFTALAQGESALWFASGGCLLRVRSGREDPELFVGPNMVVKGIAVVGPDHIWAVGLNGKGKSVWGEIAEWRGGRWKRGGSNRWGLSDISFAGMESARAGEAVAFGEFTSSGDAAIARVNEDGWVAVSATSLGKASLKALSFASDGCAWVLGRRPDGSLLIGEFIGEAWQAVVSPAVRDATSVHAVSCGEAWFGGTSLVHYRQGKWEQLQLPAGTLVRSVDSCDAQGVLAGATAYRAGASASETSGAAFRVIDTHLEPIEVQIPPELHGWSIRRVTCGAGMVWAMAQSESVEPTAATLPVLFQLEGSVLRYRPWAHSRWRYYVNELLW